MVIENTKNAVHKAAQQGFEKEAQAYARGRPDYPAALSAWLAQTLGPVSYTHLRAHET